MEVVPEGFLALFLIFRGKHLLCQPAVGVVFIFLSAKDRISFFHTLKDKLLALLCFFYSTLPFHVPTVVSVLYSIKIDGIQFYNHNKALNILSIEQFSFFLKLDFQR